MPSSFTRQSRGFPPSLHTPLRHSSRPSPKMINSTAATALPAWSSTPTLAVNHVAFPASLIVTSLSACVPTPCSNFSPEMLSGVCVTAWFFSGCRQRLADAAGLFVRHMQRNLFCHRRELLVQNFPRLGPHNVTTRAGHDTAQNQHVLKIIEVRVVWNRVAKINADGLVNFRGTRIAFGHERLNLLESFRQTHFGRQFNFRRRQKFVDRLLRKIQRADAAIARPFIGGGGGGIVVHRRERQLTQPAGHAPP